MITQHVSTQVVTSSLIEAARFDALGAVARERNGRELGARLIAYLRQHPHEWMLVRGVPETHDHDPNPFAGGVALREEIQTLPLAQLHTILK